jgi:hypothetical protein
MARSPLSMAFRVRRNRRRLDPAINMSIFDHIC